MADLWDQKARDRIREAFVAAFRIVDPEKKPKRRKRIIRPVCVRPRTGRELLAGAASAIDKLADISAHPQGSMGGGS